MNRDDVELGLEPEGSEPRLAPEGQRPEPPSDSWTAQFLAGIESEEVPVEAADGLAVEELIEEVSAEIELADADDLGVYLDEEDEAAWQAALQAANAQVADDSERQPVEDGQEMPITAPVPSLALEELLDEARRADETLSPVEPGTTTSRERGPNQTLLLTDEISDELTVVAGAVAAPPEEPLTPAHLTDLLAALRAGQAVLCAGPRLGGGQPMRDVLARLSATLPSEEVRELWPLLQSRPLEAAGMVARHLGDSFSRVLAAATARRPGGAEALRRFSALPFAGLLSTDGDDSFAEALAQRGARPAVYTPGDELAGHAGGAFLVQLFGDPRRPETLTWSEERLQEALTDPGWRDGLHQLWRERSWLFVGFEADELELQLVLERLIHDAPTGDQPHFASLPGASTATRERLWNEWRIRVLPGDPDELAEALAAALAEGGAGQEADETGTEDPAALIALLAADPDRDDARRQLDRIARGLRERGEHEALLDLLLSRVEAERSSARRAEVLGSMARLFEDDLGDPARALASLLAAYKEEPGLASWQEIERLATTQEDWEAVTAELADCLSALPPAVRAPLSARLERWPEAVLALDELAEQAGDEDHSAALEAAGIVLHRLGDRADAIARYEALAARAPGDLEVLRALDGLYEHDGQKLAYLENLERQAHAAVEPLERAALLRRLALGWEEERGGALRAEQCWQALLTIEPEADDALRALERLYRAGHRVPALLETLGRRAERAAGVARAELYGEMGALYEEVEERERAIESYLMAEAVAPDHGPTLQALARLYDETGAWHLAVSRLANLAERAATPEEALPLWLRAGELAAARLDDAAQAERYLERALEIDPLHRAAISALADAYRRQDAPARAAQLLAEAAPRMADAADRAALWLEAADLYESLHDDENAIELYTRVLESDPDHAQASAALAELLWRAERYDELIAVLEALTRPLARPLDDHEVPVLCQRLVRLGQAARARGLTEKAADAFARAAALDLRNLEAQRGLADDLLARADWDGALQALDCVYRYHGKRLSAAERVKLFSDLARCAMHLGAPDKAREFVARALRIDSNHRPSLELQAELSGDPRAVIEAKRALAEMAEPAERVRLLGELGDVYANELEDGERALEVWLDALTLAPDDRRLMHKCLDAFVEVRAWEDALGMLERLIAAETVPALRAKYHHAAAVICRDEIGHRDEAATHMRAALDDDPSAERSARGLEELCRAMRDWPELARLYRRLLQTLGDASPGDVDGKNGERRRLWSALATLLGEQLHDPAGAATAAAHARALDQQGAPHRAGEPHLRPGVDGVEQKIEQQQQLLARHRGRIASYRALKQLYLESHQPDKAAACSYALHLLGKGDASDAAAVATIKSRKLVAAKGALDEETWALLTHPDEDQVLGLLSSLVGPALTVALAQRPEAAGISGLQRLTRDRAFSGVSRYVARTVEVPPPELYGDRGQREAVAFLNVAGASGPALRLGAPMVNGKRRETEQLFELTRQMTLLRPERSLRLALTQPQSLAQLIEAALTLADEAEGRRPAHRSATLEGLERTLSPELREQVALVGRELRQTVRSVDEAALAWFEATDLTAQRVGLLLAGDLERCAKIVATDRGLATLSPTERLLDLIWSSVTEELFEARRRLGLT